MKRRTLKKQLHRSSREYFNYARREMLPLLKGMYRDGLNYKEALTLVAAKLRAFGGTRLGSVLTHVSCDYICFSPRKFPRWTIEFRKMMYQHSTPSMQTEYPVTEESKDIEHGYKD